MTRILYMHTSFDESVNKPGVAQGLISLDYDYLNANKTRLKVVILQDALQHSSGSLHHK